MPRLRAAIVFLIAPLCAAAADPQPEQLNTQPDRGDRMRVEVMIGESGPHRFVIDTRAERTVVSSELADTLQLTGDRRVNLTSLVQTSEVPTVHIPEIRIGRRRFADLNTPVLPQGAIGAEGLLGIDALKNQSVEFDFRRQTLTVTDSARLRRVPDPAGTIVVEARPRHGRLIVSDAVLDGQRITVIIDTGSQISLGNPALRAALQRRGRLSDLYPVTVWGVTGEPFTAELMTTRRFRLGTVEINDLTIGFGSAHLFERLDLDQRPALLLGMDVLRAFERVTVDFANRRLRLLPITSGREPGTRLASSTHASRLSER